MKNSNAALDEKIDAEIELAEGLKRNHGRYTLEDAAAFISERTGEDADGLRNKLIAAVKNGDLARYAPFSFVKKESGIVRDFFEHVYWNDLNGWLEKNESRLDFKFPQPIAETIDAGAQKHGEQAGAPAPQNDALVTPAKVGASDTATGKAAKPKQEIGEPFLQSKSRNSRAEVDQWVKWQAHQKVKATDNTSDLAERILAIADSWGYQSERGPMTIGSITKMLPTGLTGGRAKNKGIRGKNQKT